MYDAICIGHTHTDTEELHRGVDAADNVQECKRDLCELATQKSVHPCGVVCVFVTTCVCVCVCFGCGGGCDGGCDGCGVCGRGR